MILGRFQADHFVVLNPGPQLGWGGFVDKRDGADMHAPRLERAGNLSEHPRRVEDMLKHILRDVQVD